MVRVMHIMMDTFILSLLDLLLWIAPFQFIRWHLHRCSLKVLRSWIRSNRSCVLALKRALGHAHSTKSPVYKKSCQCLPLEKLRLCHVLEVDPRNRTATVQAFTSFDTLTRATIPHGLMPTVVPEFREITVGGAISGLGIESSSFRYGLFHSSVVWTEVVIPNDEADVRVVYHDSKEFTELVGCLGTLGFIVSAQIRLVPCSPLVRLEYSVFPHHSLAIEMMKDTRGADFIDAVVVSPEKSVVMSGFFLPTHTRRKTTISLLHAWSRPFIHRIEEAAGREVTSDIMNLRDYLFRFDRGCFFVDALPDTSVLFRLFFGFKLSARSLFVAGHHIGDDSEREDSFIVQDVCIPGSHARRALAFVSHTFGVFPIWLCPVRNIPSEKYTFSLDPSNSEAMHVNIGVYGAPCDRASIVWPKGRERIRVFEEHVRAAGGRKALYAHSYYTREEFSTVYNLKNYESLREEWSVSDRLMHVYEKACVRETS